MKGTLWIDVEDLFEYARNNSRPSGIQRLAFEIHQALYRHDGGAGNVQFVRHVPTTNSFRVVAWSEVAALFADLTEGELQEAPQRGFIPRHGPGRRMIRRLAQRLPTSLRPAVIEALLSSAAAGRAWGQFASTLAGAGLGTMRRVVRGRRADIGSGGGARPETRIAAGTPAPFRQMDFSVDAAAGDVVLVLGSPWFHPDYPGLIRTLRKKHGLRFAMLVYDLIPLRRPEWCDSGLVRLFRDWFVPMLPLCDHVFAISKATARDVEAYMMEAGVVLPQGVVPIPLGTHLGGMTSPAANAPAIVASGRALPAPGSYALIVSTIEARKNHLLLFRVWRRLLEDLPAERVPHLVFAGRVGWLVKDLMQQISNTANLGGKLIVIENPSDSELTVLYSGCLFTLFPSFYEGWGLPVTESLALGKPCLISDRTSLPEAGGKLARSFDPDNLTDAYVAIRGVIDDPADLARWEEQVRREFEPVPWSATVDALLAGLVMEDEVVLFHPL